LALWLPGIVAAAVGLAAGVWATVTIGKEEEAAPDPDTALEDLDERKDNAVLLLRQLEEQRDKMPRTQYEAERDRIERQAAEALRARQNLLDTKTSSATGAQSAADASQPAAVQPTATVGFLANRPQLRGMLWGAAIVGGAGLLYALVVSEGAPEAATGMQPSNPSNPGAAGPASTATAPRRSPEIESVLARLRQNPNDMAALVEGGRVLLRRMEISHARPFIDRALQLDPEHAESLVHYAVLLAAEGNRSEGVARLDALLSEHPDIADGWFYRGMFGMQDGDPQRMKESFARYLKLAPDGPMAAQVKGLLNGSAAPSSQAAARPAADPRGLWAAKCASCHGAEGRGDGPLGRALALPDMRSSAWQAAISDDRVRQAIRQGIVRTDGDRSRRMSAFPDLTDGQVEGLVELIRSWQGS
jgi:tetratricopeptide (TPR) repeat protein